MTRKPEPIPNDLVRVLHFGRSYVGTVLVRHGDFLEAQFRVTELNERARERYGDPRVRRGTFHVNDVELIDRAGISTIASERRDSDRRLLDEAAESEGQ